MPSVVINEIDHSRYVAPGATTSMVVLVPGTASFGPTYNSDNPNVYTFSGLAGLSEFYRIFGSSPAGYIADKNTAPHFRGVDGDISYEYVTNLLNSGATVLFLKLNEGTQAMSSADKATAKFIARHTGSYGNYLWVKASLIKLPNGNYSSTDVIINVYAKSARFSNMNIDGSATISNSDLNKLILLESYRVSTDVTSPYYENLNKFESLSTIANTTISAIIDELISSGSTNTDADVRWKKYTDTTSKGYIFATNYEIEKSKTATLTINLVDGDKSDTVVDGATAITATLSDNEFKSGDDVIATLVNRNIVIASDSKAITDFAELADGHADYCLKVKSDYTFAKNTYNIYGLYGGADFENANTEDFDPDTTLDAIHNKLSGEGAENKSVYADFVDAYLYDFDFVTSGGFVHRYDEDTPNAWSAFSNGYDSIHTAMVKLCETRGDCFALLDTPLEMPAFSTTNPVAASVIEYASNVNSSYAGIYAPWCSMISSASANTIDMCPSFIFLKSILNSMNSSVNNELWFVPAGVTRGSASFVINPKYEIGSTILNKFQNDYNYRVNPIMKVRNYGYCIYGNSTCMQSLGTNSRSALESVNVRLLCNVVKKAIFNVCTGLAFEYNDSQLWAKFYSKMDEVLIYMKRNYGLYDYKIVMDSNTVTTLPLNERRVPGKVMISPNLAGEYFDIDFEISPAGVSFNEGE